MGRERTFSYAAIWRHTLAYLPTSHKTTQPNRSERTGVFSLDWPPHNTALPTALDSGDHLCLLPVLRPKLRDKTRAKRRESRCEENEWPSNACPFFFLSVFILDLHYSCTAASISTPLLHTQGSVQSGAYYSCTTAVASYGCIAHRQLFTGLSLRSIRPSDLI